MERCAACRACEPYHANRAQSSLVLRFVKVCTVCFHLHFADAYLLLGSIRRLQRIDHWRCIPHSDNLTGREHHSEVRDMGYCWTGALQVSRTDVLPECELRSGRLRYYTSCRSSKPLCCNHVLTTVLSHLSIKQSRGLRNSSDRQTRTSSSL